MKYILILALLLPVCGLAQRVNVGPRKSSGQERTAIGRFPVGRGTVSDTALIFKPGAVVSSSLSASKTYYAPAYSELQYPAYIILYGDTVAYKIRKDTAWAFYIPVK